MAIQFYIKLQTIYNLMAKLNSIECDDGQVD